MTAFRRKSIDPSRSAQDSVVTHGAPRRLKLVQIVRCGWLLLALFAGLIPIAAAAPDASTEPDSNPASADTATQVPAEALGQEEALRAQSPQARFDAAKAALARGDRATYALLAEGLAAHPLYLELQGEELERRLWQAEADDVNRFITRYRGTVAGERVRRIWLQRLAREQRWSEYLDAYLDTGSTTHLCWHRLALLALDRQHEAFAGLAKLYLTGRSLPSACDPLFMAWSQAGGLKTALVWQRAQLALARDNVGVAAYQGRYLPSTEQPWLELLVAVHRRPERLLEAPITAAEVPASGRRQQILIHGVERLAQSSVQQAILLRESIDAAEALPTALAERADSAIGQALLDGDDDTGLEYLDRLEPRADNVELQLERLQAALRLRAWRRLADWAAGLPPSEDGLARWRYWRGKALMMVGTSRADRIAAAHAFASAATERTLWGFASAELIGRPLALEHKPVPARPDAIDRLLASEAASRVRTLSELGRWSDVRREWRELTQALAYPDKLVAAAAAAKLGLTNLSILTLARAAYWDDLELRFPLDYQERVQLAAAEHELPVDWIYAVIRQESAFDPGVSSHAGAVGLMQLMPATAREVAGKLGLGEPERLELVDPSLNIALGSAYIAEMQWRFDGHPLVATAAYNAGPGAVGRWLPDEPMPGDLWLTSIPYAETRQYARRVLTYRVIYRHRLGLPPLRVGALLRPVVR